MISKGSFSLYSEHHRYFILFPLEHHIPHLLYRQHDLISACLFVLSSLDSGYFETAHTMPMFLLVFEMCLE